MIDPKLNEIPVEGEATLTDEQRTERARAARAAGLSINDTVAANANLSHGSRGVDTSGVSAGSGAGAGSTFVTTEDTGTPAPNVVPGPRGSGTTPRGTASDRDDQ